MTHEEYEKRLDACNEAAGSADAAWNKRYLRALWQNGLSMTFVDPHPREDGNDHMAPIPYPEGWQYKYPAWVIPTDIVYSRPQQWINADIATQDMTIEERLELFRQAYPTTIDEALGKDDPHNAG